jgi:membrane associated rhomboid family serine protease
MFLPYGDTPNPPGVPYINNLLIAINIGVFLFLTLPLSVSRPDLNDPLLLDYLQALGARGYISAEQVLQQVSAYDLVVFRYGFRPGSASLLTLFSSMFLHGGWMHLVGNILFLWIFGDNVEQRLGRIRYLLGYLAAGAAATLFFALFVPDSQIPLVGASGAISGVLGCYFLWFPRNQVKTFVFLFPLLMNTFYLPARLVLGFYLVLDNLIPFLINGGRASGVAHGAHIGGFLFGLALAWGFNRWQAVQAIRKGAVADTESPARGTFAESQPKKDPTSIIVGELQAGRYDQAAQLYLALDTPAERLAVAPETVLAIGDHLLARQRSTQALEVFRRFVAERPASMQIDQAYLGAGQAMLRQPRGQLSARQYFLAAIDTATSAETSRTAREYLRRLDAGESD